MNALRAQFRLGARTRVGLRSLLDQQLGVKPMERLALKICAQMTDRRMGAPFVGTYVLLEPAVASLPAVGKYELII